MRKIILGLLLGLLISAPAANAVIQALDLTSSNPSKSGPLDTAMMPALTGDCTTSSGAVATTCTKTNGVAFTAGATNTVAAEQVRLTLGVLTPASVSVNFGSAGDNTIPIILPTGFTQVRFFGFIISQCSASITGATFGVNTASGGGGTAIVTAGAVPTVANNTANTNNNFEFVTSGNNTNTEAYTPSGGNVYFRVGTTAAATCSVTALYDPIP